MGWSTHLSKPLHSAFQTKKTTPPLLFKKNLFIRSESIRNPSGDLSFVIPTLLFSLSPSPSLSSLSHIFSLSLSILFFIFKLTWFFLPCVIITWHFCVLILLRIYATSFIWQTVKINKILDISKFYAFNYEFLFFKYQYNRNDIIQGINVYLILELGMFMSWAG